jgi:hypothetical protein
MALKFPGLSTPAEIQSRERIRGRIPDPYLGQAKEYLVKLSKLEDEEFQSFVAAETALVTAEYRRKNDEEERKRFYNASGSTAAFQHWAKAAYWSLDEAVALSFGKEPNVVTWQKITQYLQVSSFAREFSARRDLAIRAKGAQQLYDPVLPGLFISWSKRMKISFPLELENLVQEFGGFIGDWKSLYDELNETTSKTIAELKSAIDTKDERFRLNIESMESSTKTLAARQQEVISKLQTEIEAEKTKNLEKHAPVLGERERESLLKLVIGMAKGGYAYDHKAPRTVTAKEIASDLAENGVSLDEDTVRKYLREAAGLLPIDETERSKR